MTRRLWVSALLACAALYALALVAAGRATGFHVGLNDFWGNYYLSSAADLSRPGTLYNGFFPFGYTLATLCAADDGCVMLGLRDGRVHRLK